MGQCSGMTPEPRDLPGSSARTDSCDARCACFRFALGARTATRVRCCCRHGPRSLGRRPASAATARVVRLGRAGDGGDASGGVDSRCELPSSPLRRTSRGNPSRASRKGFARHRRLLPGRGLGTLAASQQPSRATGATHPVGSLVASSVRRSRGDYQRNLRLTSESCACLAC